MELHPRYDDVPPVDVITDPAMIRNAFVGQRRRLAATVAELTDAQLALPSRCDGWTVAGVLTHLIDVDRFWGASLAAGLAGTPTKFCASFDPEATPRAMVASWGDVSPAEVRATYVETTTAACDTVAALDDDAWTRIAEAPPGHVTITTMIHHALWDCWIHERDIVLPLGIEAVEDDGEIIASLAYAAGVSPTFGVWADDSHTGVLGVVATDPAVELVVDIGRTVTVSRGPVPDGAPVLRGAAVDLAEGLSQRAPLHHDLGEDDAWMVEGLRDVFQPSA